MGKSMINRCTETTTKGTAKVRCIKAAGHETNPEGTSGHWGTVGGKDVVWMSTTIPPLAR